MIFRAGIVKPISKTLIKEFLMSIVILLALSIFIFFLVFLSPGETILQEYLLNLSGDEDAYLDEEFSMSFMEAYWLWLSSSILGNFGISHSSGLPVFSLVIEFTLNTLYLTLSSLLISILIAVPFILTLVNQKNQFISSSFNIVIRMISFLPLFWLAYIVIYVSTSQFNYYPLTMDYENISIGQFILPVLLLSFGSGVIVEIIHNLSQETKRVLNEEYILCARAKGASVYKHMFKESVAFPLLNLISNRIAYLFGATVIIEQIFNWPGIGRLLWQATQDRDIPLLLGAVVVSAIVIRTAHFFSRLIYVLINPRASHE